MKKYGYNETGILEILSGVALSFYVVVLLILSGLTY